MLRAIEKLKCYVSRNKQTRLQRSTKNGSNRLYECPAIPTVAIRDDVPSVQIMVHENGAHTHTCSDLINVL